MVRKINLISSWLLDCTASVENPSTSRTAISMQINMTRRSKTQSMAIYTAECTQIGLSVQLVKIISGWIFHFAITTWLIYECRASTLALSCGSFFFVVVVLVCHITSNICCIIRFQSQKLVTNTLRWVFACRVLWNFENFCWIFVQ